MSLLGSFIQRIASLAQVDDPSHIQIETDGILIGSKTLPLINVFFSENNIQDQQGSPLSDYLDQFEVSPENDLMLQSKTDETIRYKVTRLRVGRPNWRTPVDRYLTPALGSNAPAILKRFMRGHFAPGRALFDSVAGGHGFPRNVLEEEGFLHYFPGFWCWE